MKNLRETFRDMKPGEMREASREAEIDSMTKNDAPIEYLTPAEFFRRMRVKRTTLQKFGFKKESGVWTYSAPIANGALVCTVALDSRGSVKETIADAATGDEYVQHRVAGASGKFVGRVRCEIMALMKRIADSCFERDMLGLFVLSCIAERQSKMKIRQIRNATLRINFGGVEFLIDPWLISKSEGFTFGQSPFASEVVDPTQLDIVMPMCELPMPLADVLSGVDAYVLTHLHPDHFDMAADGTVGAKLDKAVPLFVQNEDEVAVMKRSGFKDVQMFTDNGVAFRGVTLKRTFARHGTKTPCGPASGVFFTSPAEKKSLWILGDTIWCDETAEAMATLKPDVVVLNACAAQLKTYGRLIMDDADVESVCRAAPNATVIASHMDTVAHASLTRKTLRAALERRGLAGRVLMPDDGEECVF